MTLLLDTHVFLWLLSQPDKITENAMELCSNPDNIPYVSLLSLWEIQIKNQLGKIELDVPIQKILQAGKEKGISILDIKEQHILTLASLPMHHRDPFDRLLIAQSIAENMTLISADQKIQKYNAKVVW